MITTDNKHTCIAFKNVIEMRCRDVNIDHARAYTRFVCFAISNDFAFENCCDIKNRKNERERESDT